MLINSAFLLLQGAINARSANLAGLDGQGEGEGDADGAGKEPGPSGRRGTKKKPARTTAVNAERAFARRVERICKLIHALWVEFGPNAVDVLKRMRLAVVFYVLDLKAVDKPVHSYADPITAGVLAGKSLRALQDEVSERLPGFDGPFASWITNMMQLAKLRREEQAELMKERLPEQGSEETPTMSTMCDETSSCNA